MRRRAVIAGIGALFTSACSRLSDSKAGEALLSAAEDWHRKAHRLLGGHGALAREYDRADISPFFRGNGSTDPDSAEYKAAVQNGFADWRLAVRGLVNNPLSLSLADIAALPQRTQITRHDCVEGWSAIGEWTGPQLALVLEQAGLKPEARFIVFHCADHLAGKPYYESIDLADALHPQTIVAHRLNGEALPVRNGAPLRMRVERQLGYKQAKFVMRIEARTSLAGLYGGKGGYWEDAGDYQWYAGI